MKSDGILYQDRIILIFPVNIIPIFLMKSLKIMPHVANRPMKLPKCIIC